MSRFHFCAALSCIFLLGCERAVAPPTAAASPAPPTEGAQVRAYVFATAADAALGGMASGQAITRCIQGDAPETPRSAAASVPCFREQIAAQHARVARLFAIQPPEALAAQHAALLRVANESAAALERFAAEIERDAAALDRRRRGRPWRELLENDPRTPEGDRLQELSRADESGIHWAAWTSSMDDVTNRALRCFMGGARDFESPAGIPESLQVNCGWARVARIANHDSVEMVYPAEATRLSPFGQ